MVEVCISRRDKKMKNKTRTGGSQHIFLTGKLSSCFCCMEWFVPREVAKTSAPEVPNREADSGGMGLH